MGQAGNKKRRFLIEHPICCFCGGGQSATTIDHVPGRACFKDRQGPEGFEFPACDLCQQVTRKDEMAFATYVKLLGDQDNYGSEEARKLIRGLSNNLPQALPDHRLTANQKRRATAKSGLTLPPGVAFSDAPIVKIPPAVNVHIARVLQKLVLALWYRHTNSIAPVGQKVWSFWDPGQDGGVAKAAEIWSQMTPEIDVGSRPNIDFGKQMTVRWNFSEELKLFIALGQIGGGMIFFGSCAPSDVSAEFESVFESTGSYCPGDWPS